MSKQSEHYQPNAYPDVQARLHVHDHSGKTSCDEGHSHLHPGVSGPPIPYGQSHIHEVRGLTTFDFRHHHAYFAYTGPEIELSAGYHTHYIYFRTSRNFGHNHQVEVFVQVTPKETMTQSEPYDK